MVLAVLDIRVLRQILVVHLVVLVMKDLLLQQHSQQQTPVQQNMEMLVVLVEYLDLQVFVLEVVVAQVVLVELVVLLLLETAA
ncbi:MAG: hypothetical protein EB114_12925 [Betaproteobacteria bacterium]|nr:hypothetical protein [Betaproteobacteria bacterium]